MNVRTCHVTIGLSQELRILSVRLKHTDRPRRLAGQGASITRRNPYASDGFVNRQTRTLRGFASSSFFFTYVIHAYRIQTDSEHKHKIGWAIPSMKLASQ